MGVITTFSDDNDIEGLKPTLEIKSTNQFIYIKTSYLDIDQLSDFRVICLNKKSAIKLAKEIRKQISFMED